MANYPIKLLKDETNAAFVPLVSTDCIRDKDNQTLQQILDKKLSPANLLPGEHVSITTEDNNCYVSVDLPAGLTLIDNLNTATSNQGSLDAHQGKVLKDMIPEIIDDITDTSPTKGLSANQGYILNQKFNNYTLTSDLEDLIKQYILASHPIGSIEINISGANPSTYLGGTWIAWGSGKVPVGINTSDTEFNTVEKAGGSKTHTHTYSHTHGVPGVAHNHTINSHYHWLPQFDYGQGMGVLDTSKLHKRTSGIYPPQDAGNWLFQKSGTTGATSGGAQWGTADSGTLTSNNTTPSSTTTNSQSTSTSGSSSNLPPYITCYMWKRTA